MSRTSQTSAIVFSVKPQGENNSTVRLFTNSGIIYATLYGGPKSRLRPRVSVWNSGTVWLYTNEQNGAVKISDFDVKNYHLSFRTDLYKNFAASLAAEIVMKTNCAGSTEKCFCLTSGFLDGLEIANEKQSRSGLVRFLWRYLELLGIQPDASSCVMCGRTLVSESALASGDFSASCTSYEKSENGFICEDCFNSHGFNTHGDITESVFYLSAESVHYLAAISNMKASDVRLISLSEKSENELKRLLFFLVENACGYKLKTLDGATGIL